MIVTYTGRGLGVATLLRQAFMELKGEFVPVLRPEEVVRSYLPFREGSEEALVFGLGSPSDTLRVVEALKIMGYEIKLFRPPLEGLPGELAARLEVYPAEELPGDLVSSSLEAGIRALKMALEGSSSPRAARLLEDLNDLRTEVRLPENFSAIVYTNSMELAALTLSEVLDKPAHHFQHFKGRGALVLTTTSEEHWVRGLALKGKVISVPYDPLVAPLSLLYSLREELKPYTKVGNA